VARVSQGITVTWAGVRLGEVISVGVDGVSADTVEVTPRDQALRVKAYSAADKDYGTISVTCRGNDSMQLELVGLTGTLSVIGPGVSWKADVAFFQNLGWSAQVGELQTYTATFKVSS